MASETRAAKTKPKNMFMSPEILARTPLGTQRTFTPRQMPGVFQEKPIFFAAGRFGCKQSGRPFRVLNYCLLNCAAFAGSGADDGPPLSGRDRAGTGAASDTVQPKLFGRIR
jgi:hypothetical protein